MIYRMLVLLKGRRLKNEKKFFPKSKVVLFVVFYKDKTVNGNDD